MLFLRAFIAALNPFWWLVGLAGGGTVIWGGIATAFDLSDNPWIWTTVGLAAIALSCFVAFRQVWLERARDPKVQLDVLIQEGYEVRAWCQKGGRKNSERRERIQAWHDPASEFVRARFPSYWDDIRRPIPDAAAAPLIRYLNQKIEVLKAISRGEAPPRHLLSTELRDQLVELNSLAEGAKYTADRDDLWHVIKSAREHDRELMLRLELFAAEFVPQVGEWRDDGEPWVLESRDQAANKIRKRAGLYADIINKLRDRGE